MRSGIEVALCTHNGAARLPQTLAALAAQHLAPGTWSVLVIDNASTDGTSQAAVRAWTRPDVRLRVVYEPRPGVKIARERALAETDREFLCFCDDDNLFAPDYLAQALALITALPKAGALGGKGEPASDVPLPAWFADAAPGYAVGPQADAEGEVSDSRGYLYGAGMVVRCAAWEQLSRTRFETRLMSRKGTGLSSGEDNEICLLLSLLGWQIHYSPKLVFRHVIAPRRLEENYCRALYRGFGEAAVVLNVYRDFLLGHATPTAWRARALGRRAQGWLARLKQPLRPVHGGPLTTASLDREFAAGLAASFRSHYAGDGLMRLYAEIANWLATTKPTHL